jgi:tetratricopeptide (TPR) repeat protein
MIIGKTSKILAVSLAVILTACGGAEERKAKYMEKGKNYFAEKNYEKARIEFKNVMQIDPKFADSYYFIGQIEERKGDLQKAAGNYQQAIQLNPDHIEAKTKLARIFTMVGIDKYVTDAKKLLQEVFEKQPDNLEAQLVSATLDYKDGKKEQAINKLQEIISKDPSLIDAHALLAIIYSSISREDDAIVTLKSGIEKNKDSVTLRATLAQLLLKNKRDFLEIEKQILKIIELEPDNYNHRLSLVGLYGSTNQQDKIEPVLRQAIKDNEDDAQRYMVLVEYLAKRKSAKLAEEELLSAINKKPKLYDLRFALVKFYQELQLSDKAIETLNIISEQEGSEPEGIKAKVRLADIYFTKGDVTKAQNIIDDVLSEKSMDIDALVVKAKLAYQKQDDLTVINALRTVLKDEPKNNDAALLLAQAHERNNEPELAKETLVRALEADPLNPKNHLNYANYLASKNDMKQANEILDKALSYFKSDYDLMEGKLRFLAAAKDDQGIHDLLDRLMVSFPSKEEVFMQRGQYFSAKKQYKQALSEFETALKVSITVYKPLESVVLMHMALKQDQKAIELLQVRLSASPDDVVASQLLGQVFASRQDMNKALEYFNAAMKNTKWDMPYISAAGVYLQQKKVVAAQTVLEKGATQAENPVQIQLQLASLYEGQKDYDKAIAIYEKVIVVNPANQMAANNLASLLLDVRGDQLSARRALELATGFSKTRHPALMDTLGWAILKNNDSTKAISVLEEAIRMAPDVAVFQYHLGMAYHQAGDLENAKRYLSMAVSSKQEFPGKDKARETFAKL